MPRNSMLAALLNNKCPRCRKGNVFTYPIVKAPFKFKKMNSSCPHCGLWYEPEPGFFFGAMYVSYALTTGMMLVIAFILYNFFNDPPAFTYIITVIAAILLTFPMNFRLSRLIFLHVFGGINYDKSYN